MDCIPRVLLIAMSLNLSLDSQSSGICQILGSGGWGKETTFVDESILLLKIHLSFDEKEEN